MKKLDGFKVITVVMLMMFNNNWWCKRWYIIYVESMVMKMWDIFIFGDGMVMFNYGDFLVFYYGVLHIMESCALKIDVLMKCWCVFTWWVGPHACILELNLGKWWWIGIEKSSNIFLPIWCWKVQ